MKRGTIVLINLDPAIGSEANKTRPAIVVSNEYANNTSLRNGRGTITIVPVTSNITRTYPFQVRIDASTSSGLNQESKAQGEQIRSVDIRRVIETLGSISATELTKLDRALALHLDLSY